MLTPGRVITSQQALAQCPEAASDHLKGGNAAHHTAKKWVGNAIVFIFTSWPHLIMQHKHSNLITRVLSTLAACESELLGKPRSEHGAVIT